jgi:ribosome-associated heat shock protein Hsp15
MDTLRVDKWLFFARFFKTRAQATAAASGGHVHRDGERLKPAQPVRVGDEIAIRKGRYEFIVTVDAIPRRRGPASEAADCYSESEESRERRQALSESLRQDRLSMPTTKGRPDKHTRRRLRRWKDGETQ